MGAKRATTSKAIQSKIDKGHGQGTGADYQPWLSVREFPSRGLSSRPPGIKSGRHHELFSKLETGYFSFLELRKCILEIREQFLLPLEETKIIADQLNIKHPKIPGSSEDGHSVLAPMTTDFVLTLQKEEKKFIVARTIKPANDLLKKRTLEKFEIERVFWKARNVDWGIVTEKEIPDILIQNCKILHSRLKLDRIQLTQREIDDAKILLTNMAKNHQTPLREIAQQCDERLGIPAGSCLAVAYHLMACGIWIIDLFKPIDSATVVEIQVPEQTS